MSNRLRLTSILTPPADDTWRASVGYVRFDPVDDNAANWSVPGYRPAWPIIGVPNGTGTGLMETNGGEIFVPGDEPGDAYAGPWMRVSYELQTLAGTWHRGSYLWRAVSTGGGSVDMRTPAPEQEPPTVSRPGVPPTALTTADLTRLVEVDELNALRGAPNGIAQLDGAGRILADQLGSYTLDASQQMAFQRLGVLVVGFGRLALTRQNAVTFRGAVTYPYPVAAVRTSAMIYSPSTVIGGAAGGDSYIRAIELRVSSSDTTQVTIDAYNLTSNNQDGDIVVVDVLLIGVVQ